MVHLIAALVSLHAGLKLGNPHRFAKVNLEKEHQLAWGFHFVFHLLTLSLCASKRSLLHFVQFVCSRHPVPALSSSPLATGFTLATKISFLVVRTCRIDLFIFFIPNVKPMRFKIQSVPSRGTRYGCILLFSVFDVLQGMP